MAVVVKHVGNGEFIPVAQFESITDADEMCESLNRNIYGVKYYVEWVDVD